MNANGRRPWAASQLADIGGRAGGPAGVGRGSSPREDGEPAAIGLRLAFVAESALGRLAEKVTRFAIRAGAYADLTLFDAQTVIDTATFDDPIQPARGIATVIVNGRIAWAEGRPTAERSGRVLRRDPSVH